MSETLPDRYEDLLDRVERRAVERFFGYELYDSKLTLAETEAIARRGRPLEALCCRVLFEGPHPRISVIERGFGVGAIRIAPRVQGSGEVVVEIPIDWGTYRGVTGVRRLARQVLEALSKRDLGDEDVGVRESCELSQVSERRRRTDGNAAPQAVQAAISTRA